LYMALTAAPVVSGGSSLMGAWTFVISFSPLEGIDLEALMAPRP
jgi:hypothetical protein